MAVRLTNKDKEKLRRINNNVRRKNKQMDNLGIGDIYHIETLPISQVKSRKQLNDYYDNARRYTRGYGFKFKQNIYGVTVTRRELAQAKRLAQDITRERQKRFKEVAPKEFKSYGKPTGSSVYQRRFMTARGDDKYDIFDPVSLNFGTLQSRGQFERRVANYMKQLEPDYIGKKNELLKDNIIKAMRKHWGNYADKSIEYVKSLSPDEVVEQFLTEDIFDFKYIYRDDDKARQAEIFEATYNLA